MSVISPEVLLEQLRWRYATKQFDPAAKIPDALWSALEAALVLAPSSLDLQPWTFIVVDAPATRKALRSHSRDQPQVTEASRLVVFAARRDIDEAYIARFLDRVAEVRNVSLESLNGVHEKLIGYMIQGPLHAVVADWAAHQAYIALGTFLFSAALLGVDTCPLEGIEHAQYDAILGLEPLGLRTVVAAAAGRRKSTDAYAGEAKVRFRAEDVILRR